MKRNQNKQKKTKKRHTDIDDLEIIDRDDTFCFIAGYTTGGFPYGTTWEELGLQPYASEEEIEAAYNRMWEER